MVTFANMSTEFYRAFGRMGGGAVMGSKNLKAVAIRGTNEVKVADLAKYWELVEQQRAALLSPDNFWFRRWGTQAYNEWLNDTTELEWQNFQEAWLPPDKFTTRTRASIWKRPRSSVVAPASAAPTAAPLWASCARDRTPAW